ncbi:helix-turn-helix transcriptional regulator [Paraburkholderia sp. A2RI-6]|uniref:helix-turn-helix domain-containing protein n=1 Tax=Paraburkholderia sp. A2RI-6 TaxID=3028371 RepID=UPI003B767144
MTTNAAEDGERLVPNRDAFSQVAAARACARREELGLSREALGALSGLDSSALGQWEEGGIPHSLPKRERQAWERALDVPSGWLFGADNKADPGEPYREAGPRARARRDMLGITRRAVAARLGISVDTLARWEHEGVPTRIKGAQVAAWEHALRVEAGWLRGEAFSAVAKTARPRVVCPAIDARSAIIDVTARIAAVQFERLAAGDARVERERVSARIFAQRYGVDPQMSTSLAAIAKQHGIVESRVSQILKALNTTAQELDIDAVVFERIREQADPHLPCTLHELEALLRPLLGEGLKLEDVGRFSVDILGKPLLAFAKRRVNGRPEIMVASPDAGDSVADVSVHDTAIGDMARAMIRTAGVAHMGLLKTYALEEGWATEVIAKFRAVLERTAGFEWLETPEGGNPQWFWFQGYASERNLILDATRRVLAVAAGLVSFDDIMGAIGRLRTTRARRAVFSPMFDVQPPTRIIWALLQRQSWLSVLSPEAGIRSIQNIYPHDVLPPSELTVYEALRGAGGVATRAWLFTHLVRSGRMDETSFRSVVLWAPSVTRPYRGVYAIRGIQPDPSVLAEALRDSLARTGSLLPVELDMEAGRAVFHQVVNDWHVRGGWMTLPASLAAHVPQMRYAVHPDGGEIEVCSSERAAIVIKGISRILHARGLGVCDVIRLTFDLRANRLLVDLVSQNEDTEDTEDTLPTPQFDD